MVFCNFRHIYIYWSPLRCHNPYFNRWFSAIENETYVLAVIDVTILILIDGFLQYMYSTMILTKNIVTILILIDGFLQFIREDSYSGSWDVTILILIDGFLQYNLTYKEQDMLNKSQSLF